MAAVLARPLLCTVAALVLAAQASAAGGRYVFDGGTLRERAEVRAALDASRFDWNLVPAVITIRIAHGLDSTAVPARISLDADLLDAGRLCWGVVQHEYAHQVDFFLLDDARRAVLTPVLGGSSWWQTAANLPHDELTSERLASTLAWAFWPSPDNIMRPQSASDESAAVAPGVFRTFLASVLRS